jgi:hypothetical protein
VPQGLVGFEMRKRPLLTHQAIIVKVFEAKAGGVNQSIPIGSKLRSVNHHFSRRISPGSQPMIGSGKKP